MGISIGVDFLPNQIKLHELVLFCLDLHAHMMEAVVLEIILKKYEKVQHLSTLF